jgi:acyl transferase domain-containing protein
VIPDAATSDTESSDTAPGADRTRRIALVGLDCRFPGAPDPAGYWSLLTRSGDGTGEVPEQRWNAREFYAADGSPGHSNTLRGGFIADADAFDDEFFTVSPREAAAMDPQQRLLLQTAWRAIEDAGVAPQRLAGSNTGVFVGIMGNEWAQLSALDYPGLTTQSVSGNGYCMAANRISYHLDLKGPSLAVDTACSSSLVAVHLAGNALLAHECDYALACGVNLAVTPRLSIFYTQAGLSAPDGRCKPFSVDADGIGRAEGVGVVVLRRLEDALADGQRIYAVIRGTAVNQDGRSNGITAPNRWSQREVIAAACRRAGVEPAEVDFLEAHGTGTPLGDRIEANALGDLHAGRPGRPLAIGSVKGNLGHAEGAAGMAGLIKVALALHHRLVPASRHAGREDPALRLAERGLRLLKAPLRLPAAEVTVAGLSSFGLGGTNAHAILETAPSSLEPDSLEPASPEPESQDPQTGVSAGVFSLTAPSPGALRENLLAQAAVAERLRGAVAGYCWAGNEVKTGHRYRYAVAARDGRELAAALRAAARDPAVVGGAAERPRGQARIAFLFAGQGSQFPGMTAPLLRDSPLYRRFLTEADAALRRFTGESVLDLILTTAPRIKLSPAAQPALFAVEYAQARTLGELGVRPELLLGHSLGEYAAACVAQAISLEDAARLVAARSTLMHELPADGGMLAVRAGESELADLLAAEPRVRVGAINGPGATVLTGDLAALSRIAEELTTRGIRSRPLDVTHAFHSALMEPILDRFAEVAARVGGSVPRIPVYSTLRGRPLRDEPMDADYWVQHVMRPVRFAEATADLLRNGRPSGLVELGPKPVLGPLLRRLAPDTEPEPHVLHPTPKPESDGLAVAELVAALFRTGLDPVWAALYSAEERRGAQPPTPYVFCDEHRYWSPKPITALHTTTDASFTTDAAAWQYPQPPPQSTTNLTSTSAEIWDAVLAAISQVGDYAAEQIFPNSRLYEDLGFDSVMTMELKHRLEARLPGTPFSAGDLLPAMSTVGELAEFLLGLDTRAEAA